MIIIIKKAINYKFSRKMNKIISVNQKVDKKLKDVNDVTYESAKI